MTTDATPRVVGRYRLISVLGVGGSATVYLAADPAGQLVAIKILDQEQVENAESVRRFEREAIIAASIRHPNVARVIEAGRHDGVPFLVMQRVRGRTLAAHLAEHGPLPPDQGLKLMRQILAGLDEIHRQRVLLLDLKPGNIVVETRTGAPCIVDFGAACAEGESYLIDGDRVAGTPPYMAPEHRAGAAVGPPVDVYAAGIILHELITGERPPSPDAVSPTLPPALAAVVARAIAPDPAARFASVWALARALDDAAAAMAPRPGTTASLPWTRRAMPTWRRAPTLGAAIADFEEAMAGIERLTERFERFTWTVAGGRGLLVVALLVLLLAGLAEHAMAP